MNDQAQSLRRLMSMRASSESDPSSGQTRVITVTSGKGGVGKSNFTLNFALALQARGHKVLIFDADMGLANLDTLMGVSPRYNLYHLLKQNKSIQAIIHECYGGLQFIAGGSGVTELLHLSEQELDIFKREIERLNGVVDFIIFDTGAGLSNETLRFILSADETIIVTTPEPPSITDAYAVMKMVKGLGHEVNFRLVVNRATDLREGTQTADKIRMAAHRFLQTDVPALGYVLDDSNVSKAVKMQKPFTVAYPHSSASRSIANIADRFLSGSTSQPSANAGIKGFLYRMFKRVK
ncbi:sporulation initiation inhibitor protein soj [Chlamydia abortus]|uniref:MinD/ParA family protein n=1 Tax=Paenibacillus residui TaxID=629724 RepID=A0ABW3D717_9BACL|nr:MULTISPECIES: MinD/ParA family protein [Paenibacillaceae]SHE12133.1 sporulation initiation inhibitor protein soj [Chlamydia abortus]